MSQGGTTGGGGWIEVAAAVVEREDGQFLLAQRPAGKVYAGWWEFPGGKVEADETPARALVRELREELGIEAEVVVPWLTRTYEYPHGRVRLRFFRVTRWQGEPRSLEGQSFAWQTLPHLTVAPVLPANGPILSALSLPVEMAVTADPVSETEFVQTLERVLSRGIRLIHLRFSRDSADVRRLREYARDRVIAAGGRLVVNSRCCRMDDLRPGEGLHLTSEALARIETRPDLPLVGASCHTEVDLARVDSLGLDYAVLGPVLPTSSHPGEPGIGWDRFRDLAADRPFPVFAIGGLGKADLAGARMAGAHGIAAIRSLWGETS